MPEQSSEQPFQPEQIKAVRPSYVVDKENEVRMKELYPYMKDPEKLKYITSVFEDALGQELLERFRVEGKPVQILEIGAGDGIVGKFLQEYLEAKGVKVEMTLSDFNENVLREVQKNGKYTFDAVVADNKALPFKGEAFDIVLARSVTHYELTDAEEIKVLEEVKRSLKEGGMFIDQTPSFPTNIEVDLWKRVNALVGRGANMKTTDKTEAMLKNVFGVDNVKRAEEQPPKIHQDEQSFVVRHRLKSDAEKALTQDQVITQARAIIEDISVEERPDFTVSKDGFAWEVTFTIFTCKKEQEVGQE